MAFYIIGNISKTQIFTIVSESHTAEQWKNSNPIMAEGKVCIESDTKKIKVGDGKTEWTKLAYFVDNDLDNLNVAVYDSSAQPDVQEDSAEIIGISEVKADPEIASVLSNEHTHGNKSILDNTEVSMTTALKYDYDIAFSHSQASHAPTNAQKNSEITKEEIESKLTGIISSHSHSGGGGGDMLASLYDTNTDGKVDSADSADAVAWTGITDKPSFASIATSGAYSDLTGTPTIPTALSELSADSTHRLTTDTEKSTWNGKTTLSAVKSDSDISSVITNDHSHSNKALLDTYDQTNANLTTAVSQSHSNSLDHNHSNKTTLDNIQEALTTALKGNYDTAYTHSQASHAPNDAQKNSDILKSEIEAKLTGEISSHSHAGGGGDAFPVNAIYMNISGTNPATELGYGTWSQVAQGQFLVGQNGADADFDTAEETGGSKTHSHAYVANGRTGGGLVGFNSEADATASNVPPYYVVYIWKRTA